MQSILLLAESTKKQLPEKQLSSLISLLKDDNDIPRLHIKIDEPDPVFANIFLSPEAKELIPFPINFDDLKKIHQALPKENYSFSSFLHDLFENLKRKQIPFISINGFDTLSATDQEQFISELEKNPFVLDILSPDSVFSALNDYLYLQTKDERFQAIVARNRVLAAYTNDDQSSRFKDDLWMQATRFILNGLYSKSDANEFFIETKTHTNSSRVLWEYLQAMHSQLFKNCILYLKDHFVTSHFCFANLTNRYGFEFPLNKSDLEFLDEHITDLKVRKLTLNISVFALPEAFETLEKLLEKSPPSCEEIEIHLLYQKEGKFPYDWRKFDVLIGEKGDGGYQEELKAFLERVEQKYNNPNIATAFKCNFNFGDSWGNHHDLLESLKKKCEEKSYSFFMSASNNAKELRKNSPERFDIKVTIPPKKSEEIYWGKSTKDFSPRSKQRKLARVEHVQQHHQQVTQQIQIQKSHVIQQQVNYPITERTNLFDRDKFLRLYPNREALWDSVCGREASKIRIHYLTPLAAQHLNDFDYLYMGGIVNQTPQFILQMKDNKLVLDFDEDSALHQNILSPLTPLIKLPNMYLRAFGKVREWLPDLEEVSIHESIEFATSYKIIKEILGADAGRFNDFFNSIKKYSDEKGKGPDYIANTWIRAAFFSEKNDFIRLIEMLDNFRKNKPAAFESFYNNFFTRSDDFTELTRCTDIIDKIQNMTDSQLEWWNVFVHHHINQIPNYNHLRYGLIHSSVRLQDLYEAFTCFLTEYNVLAYKNGIINPDLPPVCLFKNANNIKTSLYRVLTVLKNARNFEEQVNHLAALDLSNEGASYASDIESFSLITAEMRITPRIPPKIYFYETSIDTRTIAHNPNFNFSFPKSPAIIKASSHGLADVSVLYLYKGKGEKLCRLMDYKKDILEANGDEIRWMEGDLSSCVEKNISVYQSIDNQFLTYTVSGAFLLESAINERIPLKSDYELDFKTLFYRSLGPLTHTPPYDKIVKLFDTIANQFGSEQPKLAKLLLYLISVSLAQNQKQSDVPVNKVEAFCSRLNEKHYSIFMAYATSLRQHSFNIAALIDFLKIFLDKLAPEVEDLVKKNSHLLYENMNARAANPDPIPLNVYLKYLYKYQDNAFVTQLLPLISNSGMLDIDRDLAEFIKALEKLPAMLKQHCHFFISNIELDSEQDTRGFPNLEDWNNWLTELMRYEKQDYKTVQNIGLLKLPNIKLKSAYSTQPVSMQTNLKEKLAPDVIAEIINNPSKIENHKNDSSSVQDWLNFYLNAKLDAFEFEQSMRDNLLIIFSIVFTSWLPNNLDEKNNFDVFIKYLNEIDKFLNKGSELHQNVFAVFLTYLRRPTAYYTLENISSILTTILDLPIYKNNFPHDLFKLILNQPQFSEPTNLSANSLSAIQGILKLSISEERKAILLDNLLQRLPANDNFYHFFEELLSYKNVKLFVRFITFWNHGNRKNINEDLLIRLFNIISKNKFTDRIKINLLSFLEKYSNDEIELILSATNNRNNILIILASLNKEKIACDDIIRLISKLNQNNDKLACLSEICEKRPSPNFSKMNSFLQEITETNEAFQEHFYQFPHGQDRLRTTDDGIVSILNNLERFEDLKTEQPFSERRQFFLRDCIKYIQEISQKQPFFNGKPIEKLSPEEIQEIWNNIKNIIQEKDGSRDKKFSATLVAIAILCETMYRTSPPENPIYPDATQIMVLINSAMSQGNTAFEIATGEGKSVVEAMQAAIYSLTGKTVVLSTPRLAIAERNRQDFENFYSYLNINMASTVISEHSAPEDYHRGDIVHTATSDFGLFLDKQKFAADNPKLDFYFIVSEFDANAKSLINMRHSKALDACIDEQNTSEIHWIYELVYKFTKEESDIDIEELKVYIEKNATVDQKNQLKSKKIKISDERLDRWLCAAQDLSSLTLNFDYIIVEKTISTAEGPKAFREVRILQNGEPSERAEYGAALQQLLCAKLNYENKLRHPHQQEAPFIVTPESFSTTLLTHKNLITLASDNNQLFATSATLGSKQELAEFQRDFNFETMQRVPRHLGDNRERHYYVLDNDEARINAAIEHIKQTLLKNPPQPIIIFPRSIEEGDVLFEEIKRQMGNDPLKDTRLQLYTGKDKKIYQSGAEVPLSKDKPNDQMFTENAGVSNTITITTLMNRETHIIPRINDNLASDPIPEGLLALQFGILTYCEQEQQAGRPGRRGAKGAINKYVTREELKLSPAQALSEEDIKRKIKNIQKEEQTKEHIELTLHNIKGDYLRQFYNYFLTLYYQEVLEQKESLEMQWGLVLEKLEVTWLSLIEKYDCQQPNNLDSCLTEFCNILNDEAKKFKANYNILTRNENSSSDLVPPIFVLPSKAKPIENVALKPLGKLNLYAPDEVDSELICRRFNSMHGLVDGNVRPHENLDTLISKKILEIKNKLKFEENGLTLAQLNKKILNKYKEDCFSNSKDKRYFSDILTHHNELMHLVELSNNAGVKCAVSKEINDEFRGFLTNKSSRIHDPQSNFFAYYTRLKDWQSQFDWFKLESNNDQKFKEDVLDSVYDELKSYKKLWWRSGDRLESFDRLRNFINTTESIEFIPLLNLLITERNIALQSDLNTNEYRRAHISILKRREISTSRYQKILDSAIMKLALAIEATGDSTMAQEALEALGVASYKELLKQIATSHPNQGNNQAIKKILDNTSVNSTSQDNNKIIKKLNKAKANMTQDNKSIVQIMNDKVSLFAHFNYKPVKKENQEPEASQTPRQKKP